MIVYEDINHTTYISSVQFFFEREVMCYKVRCLGKKNASSKYYELTIFWLIEVLLEKIKCACFKIIVLKYRL